MPELDATGVLERYLWNELTRCRTAIKDHPLESGEYFSQFVFWALRGGLPAEQIIEEFSVTRGTISRWASGRNIPAAVFSRKTIIERLCRMFGTHISLNEISAHHQLLFGATEVEAGIDRLATAIHNCFGNRRLVVICILQGGAYTLGKLTPRLLEKGMNFEVRPVLVSRTETAGKLREPRMTLPTPNCFSNLRGKRVLVVDDICDQGKTFQAIHQKLRLSRARETKFAALVNRATKSKCFSADLFGLETSSRQWLVGCGMDVDGKNRDLPFIFGINRPRKSDAQFPL